MILGDLPKPSTLREWYDLTYDIISQILEPNKKSKLAKRKNFSILYTAIREIHEDYVATFSDFYNELIRAKSQSDLIRAKKSFLDRRERYSNERVLTLFDAKSLIDNYDDEAELGFLLAVSDYAWKRTEISGINNRSSLSQDFWKEIEPIVDRDRLLEQTKDKLDLIQERFAGVIRNYAEIEPELVLRPPRETNS